jgi:hypothetical protein
MTPLGSTISPLTPAGRVTVPRITANALSALGLSQDDLSMLLDTNPRRALGLS